ncbi:hypothetical protein ACLKA6_012434 [Drosophila palustris]
MFEHNERTATTTLRTPQRRARETTLDGQGAVQETLDLQDEFGWCRQSIVVWKSYLREVYIDWSQRNSRVRIGGPGKIVEIDEAKDDDDDDVDDVDDDDYDDDDDDDDV